MNSERQFRQALAASLGLGLMLLCLGAGAADHGDAPLVSNDQGADIADVYAFVDPNDSDHLVTIVTSRGFITPGEAENQTIFPADQVWQVALTQPGVRGSAVNALVRFSPRTDVDEPQTAFVSLHKGKQTIARFTAPTTISTATQSQPFPFVVTTDSASGISVFAGMTDDPFFFDVPAELQFRDSLVNRTPDPSVFQRAMDTFAGFNVMSVALRIPLSVIGTGDSPIHFINGAVYKREKPTNKPNPRNRDQVDRMGAPLINTILVPYASKDRYNATPTTGALEDQVLEGIVDELTSLGTQQPNFEELIGHAINASLRLDASVPNVGAQGGTNDAAGFPNGRRLADDAADTVIDLVANGLFGTATGGDVDNVNENDKRFADTFPFLAPPHQPAGLTGLPPGPR